MTQTELLEQIHACQIKTKITQKCLFGCVSKIDWTRTPLYPYLLDNKHIAIDRGRDNIFHVVCYDNAAGLVEISSTDTFSSRVMFNKQDMTDYLVSLLEIKPSCEKCIFGYEYKLTGKCKNVYEKIK